MFLYTPVDSYEEKLTHSFIDKVTNELKEQRKNELHDAQQTVIIDTQVTLPIMIPFNPSTIGLETIEVPEQFNLPFLKKL